MSLKGYLARRGIILGNIDEVLITAKFFKTQLDPVEYTDASDLIPLALIGGIIIGTPTAAAAYTLPTGTALDAAMTSYMINNVSFDFSIMNLAATDDWIITLTANTGITIVGSPYINANEFEQSYYRNTGIFRCRKTATNTFVVYRIG